MDSVEKRIEYPEHEKLHKIKDQSQICGEFIDWLESEGYVLAKWREVETIFGKDSTLELSYKPVVDLLAEFFEIDQDKIESEKRAMLARLRSES